MTNATPLRAETSAATVSDVAQRPATLTPHATGFDLLQMLAGRRSGDRPARAWTRAEIAEAAARQGKSLEKWTLSRLLKNRQAIGERSLHVLASVLEEDVEEVRRAYTVWIEGKGR